MLGTSSSLIDKHRWIQRKSKVFWQCSCTGIAAAGIWCIPAFIGCYSWERRCAQFHESLNVSMPISELIVWGPSREIIRNCNIWELWICLRTKTLAWRLHLKVGRLFMNIAEQLWKQAWKFEILYDIVCKAKNFTDVDAGYLYSLNASTLDSSWQMVCTFPPPLEQIEGIIGRMTIHCCNLHWWAAMWWNWLITDVWSTTIYWSEPPSLCIADGTVIQRNCCFFPFEPTHRWICSTIQRPMALLVDIPGEYFSLQLPQFHWWLENTIFN